MLQSPVQVSACNCSRRILFLFTQGIQQSSRVPGMDRELMSDTLKLTAGEGKDNVWMCSSEAKMKTNFSVSISLVGKDCSFTWFQLF